MSCSCKTHNTCGDVEAILIRFIKELCSCGDKPDVACTPTYVPIRIADGRPMYITYSKNGGPFTEIDLRSFSGDGAVKAMQDMVKNEALTGFAFMNASEIYQYVDEPIDYGTADICGITIDGKTVSSVHPDGFPLVNKISMGDIEFNPPYTFTTEKTTLTFKLSEKATDDYEDFFYFMDNPGSAETITIESCSVVDLGVGKEILS